jgi:hypothetical protein
MSCQLMIAPAEPRPAARLDWGRPTGAPIQADQTNVVAPKFGGDGAPATCVHRMASSLFSSNKLILARNREISRNADDIRLPPAQHK